MAFKCPHCTVLLPERSWLGVEFSNYTSSPEKSIVSTGGREVPDLPSSDQQVIYGKWTRCEECLQVVVRFTKDRSRRHAKGPVITYDVISSEEWFVIPRRATRPIASIVAQEEPGLARDFLEAAAILDESPRLSALLSRRIEADLLEKYANLTDYALSVRIDKFVADPVHPSALKELLVGLRKIGNWTAHSKTDKDDQAMVIEANLEEATWALDVIERLFDYFIVTPEKDAAILKGINEKETNIAPPPVAFAEE